MKGRHPLPDIYGLHDLMPIMEDAMILEVALSVRELWLILGAVQLAARHPGAQGEALRLAVGAAQQIQARIIEMHPDAWLLAQMGWEERDDTE